MLNIPKPTNNFNFFLLLITLFFYIWSVINPADYFVWFLETVPVVIGFGMIFIFRKTFPLSDFLYRVILIHMIILCIGGHYTYAEVPLFNELKEILHFKRNEYDKVGHFFQGLTPALLTREIILRKTDLKNKILIVIFSISTALAFAALYEILEWVAAVVTDSGTEFVGMQGDVWDAQKDMLVALIGAIFALIFLRKFHDRSYQKIT